jgi:hypothetical protein
MAYFATGNLFFFSNCTVPHILRLSSKASKPGLRPPAQAFEISKPGQKPSRPNVQARLGPAFFGLAWPGFWPQAGAGTSLYALDILSCVPINLLRCDQKVLVNKTSRSLIMCLGSP